MITVGIDPGLTGAIAILNDGKFVAVLDMPVVAKGSGVVKNEVDPAGIITILREHVKSEEGVAVALERVNALPNQGTSSVFSLGDSFGCARSAIAACRFETIYIAPSKWKKYFQLTSDKELSRSLAVRLFPSAPINLKKHSDRAEALLLARWLYETRYM